MYTSLHICHDVNGFQKRQLYHGNFWPNFFRFKQKICQPTRRRKTADNFPKEYMQSNIQKADKKMAALISSVTGKTEF